MLRLHRIAPQPAARQPADDVDDVEEQLGGGERRLGEPGSRALRLVWRFEELGRGVECADRSVDRMNMFMPYTTVAR